MAAVFGIDTSGPATNALNTQAIPWIGGTPKFWGRYFNGTTDNDDYQYDASENAVLNQLGIPVLCFARQMWAVGDASAAKDHAQLNMQGVVDAFGAQYLLGLKIKPILYLDLEPETDHPEYVMNQQYYVNWAGAISAGLSTGGQTIPFRPAVYLNMGDSEKSFTNLNAACAGGAQCVGISVAHYVHEDGQPDPGIAPPLPYGSMVWSAANTTPSPNPIPVPHPATPIPVVVWQYYGDYPKTRLPNGKIKDGDLDFELINPAYVALVLSGVVPPPKPALTV
jgi:hypothetical protein